MPGFDDQILRKVIEQNSEPAPLLPSRSFARTMIAEKETDADT